MAVLGSVSVGAVTREDMLKLNAAYPPGSVVICETRLEGNGKNIMPMLLKTRGHIKKEQKNSAKLMSAQCLFRKDRQPRR